MRVLDHLAQEYIRIRIQILSQQLDKTFQPNLETPFLTCCG
jgi:hypothetical protein